MCYSKILILSLREAESIENYNNAYDIVNFLLSKYTETLFYLSQWSFSLHTDKYYLGDILF